MKFIIAWKIAPGHHKPAGQAFLKTGAPAPEGLTILGRWHAPGSAYGWVLVEGDDLQPLAEHVGQWADLLDMQITPVMEDEQVVEPLSRVYGK